MQLIEKLKNQGIRFGIVSSSKIEFIKKILQHFQATDLFEIIISRENVKNKKPHSEPYELATNFVQVDKNKILVIEDTIKGALSAKSAGLKVVISKEYSHLSEKEITQSGFVACVGLKQIFMLLLNK